MSLPMPERPSRSAGDRSATRSAVWTIVSEAFRYARILNGFSALISRRSPISARTLAIARLSIAWLARHARLGLHALGLDGEVAVASTVGGDRVADGGDPIRFADAEETATASSATDLAAVRAGGLRSREHRVDLWRGHTG